MSRFMGSATLVLSLFTALATRAGIKSDDAIDALDLFQVTVQNGTPVTTGDLIEKSTVLILTEDNRSCTGTLIASDLVLTAGHCVPDKASVKIAVLRDFGMQGTVPEIARKAKISKGLSFLRHDDYDIVENKEYGTQTAVNDVALIRLAQPIANATIALLPKANTTISAFDSVTLVGYGMSSLADRTIDPSKRQLVLRKADVNPILSGSLPTTFAIRGAKNTCAGDSGGPAFMRNEKGLVIVGVHSSSNGCVNEDTMRNASATDSYVPAFTDWIKGAAKRLRGTQDL